jgi:hypothetical protein
MARFVTKYNFWTAAVSAVLLFSLLGLGLGIGYIHWGGGGIWYSIAYPSALMLLWVSLTASLSLLVSRLRRLPLSAGLAFLGVPIALFQVAEFRYAILHSDTNISRTFPMLLLEEVTDWSHVTIALHAIPFYYAPLFGAALLIGTTAQLSRKMNLSIASLGLVLLLGSHLIYAVTFDLAYASRYGTDSDSPAILVTVPMAIVAFPLAILAIRKAPALWAHAPRAQPAALRLSGIERQLMDMISRGGDRISAGTAAKELGVTPEQVRRTLLDLARRGLIRL